MAVTNNGYTSPCSHTPRGRTPGIRDKRGGMRADAATPVESGFLANLRLKLALGNRRPRYDATLCQSNEPVTQKDTTAARSKQQPTQKTEKQEQVKRQQLRPQAADPSNPAVQQQQHHHDHHHRLDRASLHNPQDPPSSTDVTLASGGEDRGGQLPYSGSHRTGDGAINTNVSPAEPNILSRLIQRKKPGNRSSWAGPSTADYYIPLSDDVDVAGPTGFHGARQNQSQSHGLRPSTAIADTARAQLGKTIAADDQMQSPRLRDAGMPAPTPQQPLRKRPSLRERLNVRLRPSLSQASAATPTPAESKPRTVYVPKHAASDFSRMTVPPRAGARYSLDGARRPVDRAETAALGFATANELEDADFTVKPKRLSPPLQPLMENESTLVDTSSRQERETAAAEEQPKSRSRRNHYSYKLASDTWAGTDVPPPPLRPVTGLAQQAGGDEDESAGLLPSGQEQATVSKGDLTDFERFMARAEAEERVRRDQIMRNLSQRSAALPPVYSKPNPHQQYASATSNSNAVPPTSLNIGGGSRRSRTERPREGTQQSKRASWTPSFVRHDDEKAMGSRPSPAPQTEDSADNRPKTAHEQPPRQLRRQTSISQRIAEYVRPVREQNPYEDPVYRSSSKATKRKSFGRAPVVATVAEV